MNWKIYKLWDFLIRQKLPIDILDDILYKRLTIKLYWKWVSLRDSEIWKNIWTKKQFTIKKWQFILSKIDARNWAFWIIPEECDNWIITWNFWSYEINKNIINIDWLNLYVSTDDFINICMLSSSWATNRKYLDEKIFLNHELFVPHIEEQEKQIKIYFNTKSNFDDLSKITNKNLSYIKQLKQAILQEAIEWKLTKSWREQNPWIESASVLLEKIKAEKEELVKQKKLKKQEKLKEISEDEIPFEIPENWSWCKLGNIVINRWWKRVPKWHLLLDTKTNHIYIRVTDMNKWTVNINNLKYISDETFQVIKNYTISKDDVYLTIAWTIWRVWIIPDELDNMNLTENATKLTPIFVDKYFLKLFLETPFIQSIFQEAIVQMAQPKLALMRIDVTLFPLPPLEEQKEIVKKVDEMMKFCDELEKQSLETKENSENLMKSILSEVFSR